MEDGNHPEPHTPPGGGESRRVHCRGRAYVGEGSGIRLCKPTWSRSMSAWEAHAVAMREFGHAKS
jgi:hypothetical protein